MIHGLKKMKLTAKKSQPDVKRSFATKKKKRKQCSFEGCERFTRDKGKSLYYAWREGDV